MKKLFGIVIIILLAFTSTSTAIIHDYSESGWSTSTGMDWHTGIAVKVQKTNYGYKVSCKGADGICFQISGPDLFIYGDITPIGGGDIDIFRN